MSRVTSLQVRHYRVRLRNRFGPGSPPGTIEANGVAELVTVEHSAIGPVRERNEEYFGPTDGERRSPSAVPECDVLKLDCEGAELDILRELDFRPRVVIVETHPHVDCPAHEVEAELSRRGYEVVDEGVAGIDGSLPVLTATRRGQ